MVALRDGIDDAPAADAVTPAGDPGSRRRRAAALAGHRGDEAAARAFGADPEPGVRATALAALARMGRATGADLRRGLTDPDALVRRRACEVAGQLGGVGGAGGAGAASPAPTAVEGLVGCLADGEAAVVEAAAWALGEHGAGAARPPVLDGLGAVATSHADALCREAAVAALGAVGDRRGLPAILAATRDRPAVRRRAVLALAPFDGPEVLRALECARLDRDWQVRQAAEDLLEES